MAATRNGAAPRQLATLPVENESLTEQLRQTLSEWIKYAETMAQAGVIARPERLIGRTVGILDATAV